MGLDYAAAKKTIVGEWDLDKNKIIENNRDKLNENQVKDIEAFDGYIKITKIKDGGAGHRDSYTHEVSFMGGSGNGPKHKIKVSETEEVDLIADDRYHYTIREGARIVPAGYFVVGKNKDEITVKDWELIKLPFLIDLVRRV
jgi:hypothetical protein